MRSTSRSTAAALAVLASLLSTSAAAQCSTTPLRERRARPTARRTFFAPAPRTADGKPDLLVSGARRPSLPLQHRGRSHTRGHSALAEALFLQRVRDSPKDSPLARCLPVSVPFHNFFNLTQIVQTPGLIVILYESPNADRTVFTDGRDLPKSNPTWLGSETGEGRRHAGVTTAGFNDKPGSTARHPQPSLFALPNASGVRLRPHGFRK